MVRIIFLSDSVELVQESHPLKELESLQIRNK